jgi:hypothetical protein
MASFIKRTASADPAVEISLIKRPALMRVALLLLGARVVLFDAPEDAVLFGVARRL